MSSIFSAAIVVQEAVKLITNAFVPFDTLIYDSHSSIYNKINLEKQVKGDWLPASHIYSMYPM